MRSRLQWLRVEPQYLLTWPVYSGSGVVFVLLHFANTADNGLDHPALRIGLVLLAQVVLFLPAIVTWWLVRGFHNAMVASSVLGLAIIAGAAIRGALFAQWLWDFGLSRSLDVSYRVTVSIAQSMVVIGLLWVGVTGIRTHFLRRRQLLLERDRLLILHESAIEELAELDHRAIEDVRSKILDSLQHESASGRRELGDRLRSTIENVVRPLSHRLESESLRWSPREPSPREMQIDWSSVIRDALDPAHIRPLLIVAALTFMGMPATVARSGWSPALVQYFEGILVGVLGIWLAKSTATRLAAGRSAAVRRVLFVVALLVGGTLAGLSTLIFTRDTKYPLQFVFQAPHLTLLIASSYAIARTAYDRAMAVEEALASTTSEARWQLARLREQHRQQQRALAHAVHGRIQANVAAALLQVEAADRQSGSREEFLRKVEDHVVDVVRNLDMESSQPDPLPLLLEKVRSAWAGATTVAWEFTSDVEAALAADPQCLTSLNDVIPELVFNSVKHGRAATVHVRLEHSRRKTLLVEVRDDGRGDLTTDAVGLGTRLLDDCSLEWSRARERGQTITRVVLPITA